MTSEELREPDATERGGRAPCGRSTSWASPCRRSSTPSASSRPTPRRRSAAGPTLPDAYEEAHARAHEIEGALSGAEHEPVPCHDDLLAANFIRGADAALDRRLGVRGDGRPLLRPRQLRGQQRARRRPAGGAARGLLREPPDERRLATLRLMRFMSDFREAMWGVVQTVVSELDFDFDDYGRSTSSACTRPRRTRASPAGSRRCVAARNAACRIGARCVIIGGGVGGTSIAYHLAKLGYDDVVLLERAELTSGSTFHSAGLVGQLRGSVSLTKMMMHSVELYRRPRRTSPSSTPAGSSAAGSASPRARSGWRSCAARRGGRRPSACRSS